MKIEQMKLWENTPGLCEEVPTLTAYIPDNKTSDAAIVIFPGGGYRIRASHEGDGYARFLANNGITAFVSDYRVNPHLFPLPLLDARRSVRTVRSMAEKYGIDKSKVAVMGSSAGGHLAALVSTYYEPIDFENIDAIDKENFVPNAQILCYAVIKLFDKEVGHMGSSNNFLGEEPTELREKLSPDLIATEKAPQAFVWHTFEDAGVNVINSLDYVKRLRMYGVPTELHVFPHGKHGLGLADGDPAYGRDTKNDHVARWSGMLLEWLKYIGYNK